jgi:hypothetical protein
MQDPESELRRISIPRTPVNEVPCGRLPRKGKPAARRGRKATGLPRAEAAGSPKGECTSVALGRGIDNTRSCRSRAGLRGVASKRVKAQLRTSSHRRSKILKDRGYIEANVEVEGVGRLVLNVDCEGRYSLRGFPAGDEASGRDPLALGVMYAEGIEAIHPRRASATEDQ